MILGTHNGSGLGAEAGMCPPRAAVSAVVHRPTPSAAVRKLQTALRGLAKRVRDSKVSTVADGLIGPHTRDAVNYAMPKYGGGPPDMRTGKLTSRQVVGNAAQLTALIDAAARGPAADQLPDNTQPNAQPGADMPPYYQQPGYAPAPYYPPPAGGLPPDQASLDVRAFIPAQYEHVRINPTWVMVGLGIAVAVLVMKNKEKKGRD